MLEARENGRPIHLAPKAGEDGDSVAAYCGVTIHSTIPISELSYQPESSEAVLLHPSTCRGCARMAADHIGSDIDMDDKPSRDHDPEYENVLYDNEFAYEVTGVSMNKSEQLEAEGIQTIRDVREATEAELRDVLGAALAVRVQVGVNCENGVKEEEEDRWQPKMTTR